MNWRSRPAAQSIRVVEQLRAINSPARRAGPALVMAAHASAQAAVSSKFEVYPRGMPAKRSLARSKRLTGVRERPFHKCISASCLALSRAERLQIAGLDGLLSRAVSIW
jgi:hypothetical protein